MRNKNSFSAYLFILLAFGAGKLHAQLAEAKFQLIPYPSKLIPAEGSFTVTAATVILTPADGFFKNEAAVLSGLFTNSFGRPLQIDEKTSRPVIQLLHDATITAPEGYHLTITKEQVTISAGFAAGIFMAIQTIRQLLPALIEEVSRGWLVSLSLPALTIADEPAFSWRGLHLDVSRHFFSIHYLQKLIDLMALYKFNKLHLHLTDDQGWRIEIKKYPLLTERGAWRSFNKQDSACMQMAKDNPDFIIDPSHIIHKDGKTLYGGFYTQEEMKGLVAYALARHIDIIPEVDMPGHMMAAVDNYNYLSCDSTSAFGKLFSIPICPCRPATLDFAKDIFSEIMDIFPSEYIHIGGDEVDRSYWEKSPECKKLMQDKGFTTSAELQSMFIREMESFFNAKGRKLIGWDEILEGGISKTAAVMYWRTWVPRAPIEAARNGNKVIMTPGNPLYFSAQPDKNSLAAVYHYQVIPKNLSVDEAKNIIGAQANVWTERIPTEQRADYSYMPGMTALAEILWTGRQDYASFLHRLHDHYRRLDLLHVNYRLPDLPLLDNYAFISSTTLSIPGLLDDITIRYTTDGSVPGPHSAQLDKGLLIDHSQYIRLAAFKFDGRRGDVYDLHFKKQVMAMPENKTVSGDGLIANWFGKAFDSTTKIAGAPDKTLKVSTITVPKEAEAPSFTIQYRGYINVPAVGIYTFYLTSDDAAVLRIAEQEVVNNDGMHAPKEKNGQIGLGKGMHAIALDFIEGGGGYTLKLQYSLDGSEPQDIPANWLKY